jgi:hypothetical protein
MTMLWPAIIGVLFLTLRLAGDFDGLWRQRRPYVEALGLSFFVLGCIGLFRNAAWLDGDLAGAPRALRRTGASSSETVAAIAHPWLAMLSAVMFLLSSQWRSILELRGPRNGRCSCGYPSEFSVCPECGVTVFGSRKRWVEQRMWSAWFPLIAASMLATAAIGTYSPA